MIVITTKKGSDSNLRFNYFTNLSVSTITVSYTHLDVYKRQMYRMLKLFLDGGTEIIMTNMPALIIGNVVAFVVALLAIKFFISFVTKYGFKSFGWYRIIVVLLLFLRFVL